MTYFQQYHFHFKWINSKTQVQTFACQFLTISERVLQAHFLKEFFKWKREESTKENSLVFFLFFFFGYTSNSRIIKYIKYSD